METLSSDPVASTTAGLVLLGVPEREATIYLALLEMGTSKAGEVAAKLGLHRLDVYHDLKTLQSRDMVEGIISKPMKFKARSLETVVEKLQRQEAENVRAHSEALSNLRKATETLKLHQQNGSKNVSSENKIQIISGQKAISEKWTQLLAGAQTEILVAAVDRGSAKLLLMREMEEISKKIKEGVSVRIFTPVSNSNAAQFKEVASEVRHLDSINSAGVCIVDRSEVMIIPESAPGEAGPPTEETALLITSPSIVEMFRVLFFVGWDTSPVMETS